MQVKPHTVMTVVMFDLPFLLPVVHAVHPVVLHAAKCGQGLPILAQQNATWPGPVSTYTAGLTVRLLICYR